MRKKYYVRGADSFHSAEIEATQVVLDDGTLKFYLDDELAAAFAPGWWASVKLVGEGRKSDDERLLAG